MAKMIWERNSIRTWNAPPTSNTRQILRSRIVPPPRFLQLLRNATHRIFARFVYMIIPVRRHEEKLRKTMLHRCGRVPNIELQK